MGLTELLTILAPQILLLILVLLTKTAGPALEAEEPPATSPRYGWEFPGLPRDAPCPFCGKGIHEQLRTAKTCAGCGHPLDPLPCDAPPPSPPSPPPPPTVRLYS